MQAFAICSRCLHLHLHVHQRSLARNGLMSQPNRLDAHGHQLLNHCPKQRLGATQQHKKVQRGVAIVGGRDAPGVHL